MSVLSLPLLRVDRVEHDHEAFSPEERKAAYLEAVRQHFQECFRKASDAGKPVLMTAVAVPDPDPGKAASYDALYQLEGGSDDRFDLRYAGWRRIQKDQAEALVHELKPEEAAARSALERELRARARRILQGLE